MHRAAARRPPALRACRRRRRGAFDMGLRRLRRYEKLRKTRRSQDCAALRRARRLRLRGARLGRILRDEAEPRLPALVQPLRARLRPRARLPRLDDSRRLHDPNLHTVLRCGEEPPRGAARRIRLGAAHAADGAARDRRRPLRPRSRHRNPAGPRALVVHHGLLPAAHRRPALGRRRHHRRRLRRGPHARHSHQYCEKHDTARAPRPLRGAPRKQRPRRGARQGRRVHIGNRARRAHDRRRGSHRDGDDRLDDT